MIRLAGSGSVYVPFCGEGDVATNVYKDKTIHAADIEADFVSAFADRMPEAKVIQADCEGWPFPNLRESFSIADFDAYAYPYCSFWSFWENTDKNYPLALFFTDGQSIALKRNKMYRTPNMEKITGLTLKESRLLFNRYWSKVLLPWIKNFAKEQNLSIQRLQHYRGMGRSIMTFWGVVLDEKRTNQ